MGSLGQGISAESRERRLRAEFNHMVNDSKVLDTEAQVSSLVGRNTLCVLPLIWLGRGNVVHGSTGRGQPEAPHLPRP